MFRAALDDIKNDKRDKLVIDIRSNEDYRRLSYPGAVNIYWEDFYDHIKDVPADRPVYLICYTGQRSDDIAQDLNEKGYEVYSLEGGFHAYMTKILEELNAQEDKREERQVRAEKSIIKKFRKKLWCRFTKAIREYDMIQDGDRIAVCISGGKDSMLMAKLFQELKKYGKHNFDVEYLIMDPGYNEVNRKRVMDNTRLLGIPARVFKSEIYDIVAGEGQSPCYLCARMRRGHLYAEAAKLGCNKIALGHHYDDVIETILMGMLYGSQIQTMMPKLHSQNFEGMQLIRPMYLIREDDIKAWRDYNELYFIQCACRFTESCASCGGTGKGSKRAEIKALIKELHKKNPYVENAIFKSVYNVNLDTVIGYKKDGVRHNFLDDYEN